MFTKTRLLGVMSFAFVALTASEIFSSLGIKSTKRLLIFPIWGVGVCSITWLLTCILIGVLGSAPSDGLVSIVELPISTYSSGEYLFLAAMALFSLSLLVVFGLIWQNGYKRLIGFQCTVALVALSLGCFLSIGIYNMLGSAGNSSNGLLITFFDAIQTGQLSSNTDFGTSCLIGFGLAAILMFFYFCFIVAGKEQELGKAKFAGGFEIHKAGLLNSRGFVLANSSYGKLRFTGFEPIIVVAGTGGGKTTGIVIPNMLELTDENIVLTDIKGDIYKQTHEYRKSIGSEVFRFEPVSKTTHRYNPLAMVRPDQIDEDLDIIFKTLIPDSHESIWADASRSVCKMMAMYEMLELNKTPTLQGIYRQLCNPSFIDGIYAIYETIKDERISNLFGKFISAKDQTRRDFLLSALQYLSPFDSPNLAYATGKNDFNFDDLRKKSMTIYLIIPAGSETYGSICSIFFEQMVRISSQKEPERGDYSINAIIDEFANIPKIPSIAKGISYLRSYRVRVCAFVQGISQLKEVYGENMKEGFMSVPLKIAFNVSSKDDASYFSELAGKKTITVRNSSSQQGLNSSVSTQKQYQNLLTHDEIMRLDKKYVLIYRTGSNVIKATHNAWYKSFEYKNLLVHKY